MTAGCEQGLSPEVWETMSLTPLQNGTLTGQSEVTNANNCNTSRTVTLARTGDVDITGIDDPAKLPAWVRSPAAGFLGHYKYTYTSHSASHDVEGYAQAAGLLAPFSLVVR
jgi:hypothetical protein